jgi:hypothetical protein
MPLGGGGGGQQTTVTKSDPWEGQQGYLKDIFAKAQQSYSGGMLAPEYFGGQTVASQAPETLNAQNMTTQRAMEGSPVTSSAKGLLTDTLNGSYLNSNPYLDATFNRAADQVESRVNSAFEAGGRHGGGANQRVLGQTLGDLATNIYGQNYQQERGRQQQGILLSPQVANQDYTDLQALSGVGAAKEGYNQNVINSDIAKYNYNANLPYNGLLNYSNLVQGNYGGTSTQSSPSYNGGLLGGVGNAASAVGNTASAGLSAYALYALLSDARAKTDITYTGEIVNGIPLATFAYRDDTKTRYMGVIAQDVVKTHPHAIEVQDGLMKVYYDLIGVECKVLH